MKPRLLFALATTAGLIGCNNCNKPADTSSEGGAAPAASLIYDAAVVNDTTVPTAVVQKTVNPFNYPAYNGPTGSLEGIVRKNGLEAQPVGLSSASFAQCPAGEKMYGKTFREGEPDAAGRRPLIDAVVAVNPAAKNSYYIPAKSDVEAVNIIGCGYERRTVVMTFGQRLEVKNLTKEFWVPELDPKVGMAMMMAPPNGADPVKLYPKQAGLYHLVDHDRKYVVTDLLVSQQSLHAVTDENGHYRIDGIPVGAMKVQAQHPRIPGPKPTADVEIKEGVVTQLDLTMNYEPTDPKDAGTDGWTPYPGLH